MISYSTDNAEAVKENSFLNKLKSSLSSVFSRKSEVDEYMALTENEQAARRAERIRKFGLADSYERATATGDKTRVGRIKDIYGYRKGENPLKALKLTPGVNMNLDDLMTGLKTTVEKNMFKAQTGGGGLRNLLGSMTFYAGMPSLEKSRSQTEALNQIMANIRQDAIDILEKIKLKEKDLRGMETKGEAIFDDNGVLTADSTSEAVTVFAEMEEHKDALRGILADLAMVNEIIDDAGGNVSKVFKKLTFFAPELRKNNAIVKNINAGLDKSGKALKFKTRFAEILNYSYQLMARSIGQMFKNWMAMLNPVRIISNLMRMISNLINRLIQTVKSAFQDFASYDVKWQRTMNVVKYNLRTVLRPMMEWIAQKLVNIIGFFDIISMKIQAAFGKTPISLFDQSAADAEKMREETEQAANVAAGFDELHDISGETAGGGDPAMDLMGEIYKPQLSEKWKALAEEIGGIFADVIKGDMGFGEAMKRILDIAWEGAKKIWDWFKNTEFGEWLIKQWNDLLSKLWKIFLAWQLIKFGGKILYDALFGGLKSGGFTKWLSELGTSLSGWFTKTIGGDSFGSGILAGLFSAANGMGLAPMLSTIFKNPEVVKEIGGWGKTLGMVFTQAFGAVLGGVTLATGINKNAKAGAYNAGLRAAGGNSEDEQSYLGGNVMGAVGGGLLGMFLVGGPLAIGIGAIAGLFATALAPAIQASVERARDLNNEMQSIEYYQGMVQGYTTEVNKWTEMEKLLSETLRLNTDKVINEGVALGHSKERMIELTNAVLDGKFTTDMLKDSEQNLMDMLTNLDAQQEKNRSATEKLEAVKRKLEKAELDLSIAEDIAAGNFELAAARVEYALASEVYTADDATRKITQIIKEGSDEQAEAILKDLSPEMTKNFLNYEALTTKEAKGILKIWENLSEDTKQSILDSVGTDTQNKFGNYLKQIDREIESHVSFWDRIGDTLKEIFTLGNAVTKTYNNNEYMKNYNGKYSKGTTVSSMAVGTNYVPSDGLVYLHQGEAVIPKKYNRPYEPQGMSPEERAYMEQMMGTMRSLDNTMKQGISVNGQFVQRGSDLVAVVNRTKSQTGADLLSNVSYAR